jgi:hypothetical protein
VYAGSDPLTRRQIRLKATAKTEQQAHIELGRLLKEASEGRTPESAATVAKLLDEYASIAPWDVSTRQINEGFIRPGGQQFHGLVHVPPRGCDTGPEPGRELGECLAFARYASTSRACRPEFSFRQRDPIALRWRRMIPDAKVRALRDNGSAGTAEKNGSPW